MKINNIKIFMAASVLGLGLTSCEDFWTVRQKIVMWQAATTRPMPNALLP